MKSKIINIINSKLCLLIIGFLLTGLVGSCLNHRFQKEAWKRQVEHEVVKKQLDQTYESIEKAMLHASKRFYSMQKVFWSLESNKSEEARQRWKEYSKIKDDWNIMLRSYRSKIKILLNAQLAYGLLGKDDARDYKNKTCLHSLFVVTHYKLRKLLKHNGSNEQERKEIELAALNSLSELGKRIGDFSDKCYKAYTDKYKFFEEGFEE